MRHRIIRTLECDPARLEFNVNRIFHTLECDGYDIDDVRIQFLEKYYKLYVIIIASCEMRTKENRSLWRRLFSR